MTLYELTDQYRQVWDLVDNPEIPEDAILDTLEGIQGEIMDKAESIAIILKKLNADVEAFKQEEKNLKERLGTIERKIDRLTDYLSAELQKAELLKVTTPRASISFRASKAVEIRNEDEFLKWAELNADYLLDYKAPTISKSKVKTAIDDGKEIPYAEIVTRNNLQIK